MKITGGKIDGFVKQPDTSLRAVLIYGPDQGLVRERADLISKTIVDIPDDPFRVTELTGDDLTGDPARLMDEALSMSMIGGDKIIRLRDFKDTLTKIITPVLDYPSSTNLIIAEADALTPRSSLRKLFEASKTGAIIACYGDEARDLPKVINESLQAQGLTASRDAMAYLVSNLGGDRRVTRNELEKLCLYVASEEPPLTEIHLAQARAVIGDNTELALDNVIYAACGGNSAAIEKSLLRAFEEGLNSIAILRSILRHMQRLQIALAAQSQLGGADKAMASLRPPVNFKQKDAFKRLMSLWSQSKITQAMEALVEAEINCKSTGMPAELICSRVMMRIGQLARR